MDLMNVFLAEDEGSEPESSKEDGKEDLNE